MNSNEIRLSSMGCADGPSCPPTARGAGFQDASGDRRRVTGESGNGIF